MPDYDTWNRALIAYFVEGVPIGSPVYLAADDDAIARISRRLNVEVGESGMENPVEDFLLAIRARVVRDGTRVDLRGLRESDGSDQPRCAAFLTALVIAASRMRDTGDLDDVNYFGRLREVLGLPPGAGRPDGMRFGAESEEPLWRFWNFWLQVQGRLPSAVAGGEGPQRFIYYARSQALLRGVDQDRLIELFRTKNWRADLDADALFLRVRREAQYLTVQLRDLLAADTQRQQAVAEAIHSLYEQWRADPSGRAVRTAYRTGVLYAGLYRTVDPLDEGVVYHLYPRAPRGGAAPELRVQLPTGMRTLRSERPGWYRPLDPVSADTLMTGARYPIEQPAEFDYLVLPERSFWLLVPDPEDPEVGATASWGPPRLGIPFTLLCTANLLDDVRTLEQEGQIQWRGEPVPVLGEAWVELRDCLVISEAWSGAHFSNSELHDALRPADRCNIALSGGLRLPDAGGWLEEHGPDLTVFGFDPEAQVVISAITGVETERIVLERSQRTGEMVVVPWPGPGRYRVAALCAGQETQRLVSIVSWDIARVAVSPERESLQLSGARVCGAAID